MTVVQLRSGRSSTPARSRRGSMSRMRWMGASAYGLPAAQLVRRARRCCRPGRPPACTRAARAPRRGRRRRRRSPPGRRCAGRSRADSSGASTTPAGMPFAARSALSARSTSAGVAAAARRGQGEGHGGAERRGREAGTRHPGRVSSAPARAHGQDLTSRRAQAGGSGYSHSMVPGGLDVRSRATRLTPSTSLMMRLEIRSRRSYGSRAQSAVIASSEVTARMTIGYA